MMIRSTTLPGYNYDDDDYYEFDPHVDFAKFLKEAKTQSGIEVGNQEIYVEKAEEVKKKKKSWRKSLFSWMKLPEKKMNKSTVINDEPPNIDSKQSCRRDYVSGPLNGGGGSWRSLRSARSGPLSGLFNLTKKMEEEEEHDKKRPYVSINIPPTPQSYGPVYLVT